jgi:hypothetical protein
VADALLEPERLRDHVRGGDGQDRRDQETCSEQADGEEHLGVAACERLERAGGVGGVVDVVVAVKVESCAGGDDDEAGDEVGEDRPGGDLGSLGGQVLGAESLFNNRRLDVELHERSDRGAGGGDEERMYAEVRWICGTTIAWPTFAHCGLARMAAIG